MGKMHKSRFQLRVPKKLFEGIFRTTLWIAQKTAPIVLLAALVWFSCRAIRNDLLLDPAFRLRTVDVSTDGTLTSAEVVRLLPIRWQMSLFDISLPKVAKALRTIPSVKHFTVCKRFPNRLVIEIQERKPVFQLRVPGSSRSFLVDSEGMLLRFLEKPQPELLIVEDTSLSGKFLAPGKPYSFSHLQSVLSAYAMAKQYPLFKDKLIQKISIDHLGNLSYFIPEQLELKVGREAIADKLAKLTSIENILDDKKERQSIRYIDLRFDDIIVRYK